MPSPTGRQIDRKIKEIGDMSHKALDDLPAAQRNASEMVIEYHSANAYRTLIREVRVCTFGPRTEATYARGDMYDPS